MFSILIPFKHGGEFARSCISSVLASFRLAPFEIIIVLDRPDNHQLTLLMDALSKRSATDYIRVLASPGSGISDALNFGIQHATFPYIVRLDIDDCCTLRRARRLVAIINGHSVGCVFGSIVNYPALTYQQVPLSTESAKRTYAARNPFFHPATTMERAHLLELGGYNRDFDGVEDYELWFRVLSSNRDIFFDPEPHAYYRRHPQQFTAHRKSEAILEKRRCLQQKARIAGWDGDTTDFRPNRVRGLASVISDLMSYTPQLGRTRKLR